MDRIKKLRDEVRDLYNEIFPWQISPKARNVCKYVISGFNQLYCEVNPNQSWITIYLLHHLSIVQPEHKNLEMLKMLLLGYDVRIPKTKCAFNMRIIYSHFVPGEKINLNLKNEKYY